MASKTKLGKVDTRALDFCENTLKEHGGGSFTVEWKRSQMWGANPQVYNYHGDRMVNVSGCGYCKISTALADLLCFLGSTDDERNAIRSKGGCGEDPVIETLAGLGWDLKKVAWTKTTDTYTINVKA